MNEFVLTARHALGKKVSAEALVAKDGFSARYDLNRLQGVFSRPTHKLVGQSYKGRILVLDTAKGGVASAWMLHEMQSRNMAPVAIVFNTVNPILAQGAALGGISMLAGFDRDVTEVVPHGSFVEIDPEAKTLRVLRMSVGESTPASFAHGQSETSPVHVVPPRR
ncbi:aconitase X swivel domain-containing protein [Paraburkholderia elongata]|uniref:DUF126 domain-containing protein n=1 Tax=Paraburkholderia elongata TaxID=2675747 RepID=A0A972NR25_9BURK|nr:DUF126 domain-containing protein [Paraburkholderia elongata]NPT58241.1 DUF126 domain-containing protein [Paraburkholderia elongata]